MYIFPFNLVLFIVQRCVLLDIEGTTTPVSFVTDVLSSYAHDNVGKHLTATYDSEETQNDINMLRSQVRFFSFHPLSSTLWYLFFCNVVHSFYRFPYHMCRFRCIYRKMHALDMLCYSTLLHMFDRFLHHVCRFICMFGKTHALDIVLLHLVIPQYKI